MDCLISSVYSVLTHVVQCNGTLVRNQVIKLCLINKLRNLFN